MAGEELGLAALFQRLSPSATTGPLEAQPYWPRILRLMRMADNGLNARAWSVELLIELGVARPYNTQEEEGA